MNFWSHFGPCELQHQDNEDEEDRGKREMEWDSVFYKSNLPGNLDPHFRGLMGDGQWWTAHVGYLLIWERQLENLYRPAVN